MEFQLTVWHYTTRAALWVLWGDKNFSQLSLWIKLSQMLTLRRVQVSTDVGSSSKSTEKPGGSIPPHGPNDWFQPVNTHAGLYPVHYSEHISALPLPYCSTIPCNPSSTLGWNSPALTSLCKTTPHRHLGSRLPDRHWKEMEWVGGPRCPPGGLKAPAKPLLA